MDMFVFKAKGLSKEWDGKPVFQGLAIELRKGEHVALFGRNGSGKTTLINGLLGKEPFDGGTVQRFVPLNRWGVLEQDPVVDSDITTQEYVQRASETVYRLKKELDYLQEQPTFDIEKYNDVYNEFLMNDGYRLESEAESALHEVNLPSSVWQNSYGQLSGGQKTRAQLARLILKKSECIIMDEPTNHLDQETMEWLENWLVNYQGAVLFVSHDRLFLDRTAQAIYELTPSECTRYEGGYTAYCNQKDTEYRTQETLYQKQEQRRDELKETIRNYRQWYQQAHKAAGQNDFARAKATKHVSRFKAKEKELERLDHNKIQKPQPSKKLHVNLDAGGFSARRLLHLDVVSFSYNKKSPFFLNVDISLYKGERLGVIGPNGSGKSTLLKLIAKRLLPNEGVLKQNPQTKVGYFAQELENLHKQQTILDSILELPNMTQSEARTILGCFLFSRESVFKRISDLSMGEKCRVAFLHLYFSDANLLVLDEPTNFLDVDSKEIIEDALQSYPGALIVVSHDRYLIKKVANRIIDLKKERIVDYDGTYEEFLEHKMSADDYNPNVEKEFRELELRLTRLMSTEAENEEEHENVLAEILETRQLLNQLK